MDDKYFINQLSKEIDIIKSESNDKIYNDIIGKLLEIVGFNLNDTTMITYCSININSLSFLIKYNNKEQLLLTHSTTGSEKIEIQLTNDNSFTDYFINNNKDHKKIKYISKFKDSNSDYEIYCEKKYFNNELLTLNSSYMENENGIEKRINNQKFLRKSDLLYSKKRLSITTNKDGNLNYSYNDMNCINTQECDEFEDMMYLKWHSLIISKNEECTRSRFKNN